MEFVRTRVCSENRSNLFLCVSLIEKKKTTAHKNAHTHSHSRAPHRREKKHNNFPSRDALLSPVSLSLFLENGTSVDLSFFFFSRVFCAPQISTRQREEREWEKKRTFRKDARENGTENASTVKRKDGKTNPVRFVSFGGG